MTEKPVPIGQGDLLLYLVLPPEAAKRAAAATTASVKAASDHDLVTAHIRPSPSGTTVAVPREELDRTLQQALAMNPEVRQALLAATGVSVAPAAAGVGALLGGLHGGASARPGRGVQDVSRGALTGAGTGLGGALGGVLGGAYGGLPGLILGAGGGALGGRYLAKSVLPGDEEKVAAEVAAKAPPKPAGPPPASVVGRTPIAKAPLPTPAAVGLQVPAMAGPVTPPPAPGAVGASTEVKAAHPNGCVKNSAGVTKASVDAGMARYAPYRGGYSKPFDAQSQLVGEVDADTGRVRGRYVPVSSGDAKPMALADVLAHGRPAASKPSGGGGELKGGPPEGYEAGTSRGSYEGTPPGFVERNWPWLLAGGAAAGGGLLAYNQLSKDKDRKKQADFLYDAVDRGGQNLTEWSKNNPEAAGRAGANLALGTFLGVPAAAFARGAYSLAQAPKGYSLQSAARGAGIGAGTAMGATLAGAAHGAFGNPEDLATGLALRLGGGLVGGVGTSRLLGPAPYEKEKAEEKKEPKKDEAEGREKAALFEGAGKAWDTLTGKTPLEVQHNFNIPSMADVDGFLDRNPAANWAAWGLPVGAGLGLAGGLMNRKKNKWKALGDAAVGGLLGAGAGGLIRGGLGATGLMGDGSPSAGGGGGAPAQPTPDVKTNPNPAEIKAPATLPDAAAKFTSDPLRATSDAFTATPKDVLADRAMAKYRDAAGKVVPAARNFGRPDVAGTIESASGAEAAAWKAYNDAAAAGRPAPELAELKARAELAGKAFAGSVDAAADPSRPGVGSPRQLAAALGVGLGSGGLGMNPLVGGVVGEPPNPWTKAAPTGLAGGIGRAVENVRRDYTLAPSREAVGGARDDLAAAGRAGDGLPVAGRSLAEAYAAGTGIRAGYNSLANRPEQILRRTLKQMVDPVERGWLESRFMPTGPTNPDVLASRYPGAVDRLMASLNARAVAPAVPGASDPSALNAYNKAKFEFDNWRPFKAPAGGKGVAKLPPLNPDEVSKWLPLPGRVTPHGTVDPAARRIVADVLSGASRDPRHLEMVRHALNNGPGLEGYAPHFTHVPPAEPVAPKPAAGAEAPNTRLYTRENVREALTPAGRPGTVNDAVEGLKRSPAEMAKALATNQALVKDVAARSGVADAEVVAMLTGARPMDSRVAAVLKATYTGEGLVFGPKGVSFGTSARVTPRAGLGHTFKGRGPLSPFNPLTMLLMGGAGARHFPGISSPRTPIEGVVGAQPGTLDPTSPSPLFGPEFSDRVRRSMGPTTGGR